MSSNEEPSALAACDRLLWGCLRHVVTGELPSVDGGIPPQIIDRARNHKLLPIVGAALPNLPSDLKQIVQTESRKRRIRALVMTREMLRVSVECAKNGIRIIPLKGVAYANTVYPSPTLRYFDDLDLLVYPENADEALAILHKLGYRPHERGSADWHHARPQTHPQHGTTIELHTDLVRRYGHEQWAMSDIWQRVDTVEIQGQTVEILSTTDALVYTALHARHHLFEKPTFLLDTALLLKECFGSARVEAFQAAGALVPFVHILNILDRYAMLPHPLAADAPKWRLAIAKRIHGWDDFSPRRDSLRGGTLPKLIEPLLMDSFGDSWAMIRTLLVPDAAFVREKYGSTSKRLAARLAALGQQLFSRE